MLQPNKTEKRQEILVQLKVRIQFDRALKIISYFHFSYNILITNSFFSPKKPGDRKPFYITLFFSKLFVVFEKI